MAAALLWSEAVVGLCVSLLFLVGTFTVLCCCKRHPSTSLYMRLQIVITFIITNIIVLAGLRTAQSETNCRVITCFLHMFVIGSFTSICAEQYIIWARIIKMRVGKHSVLKIISITWAIPVGCVVLLMLGLGLASDASLQLRIYKCWRSDHVIWSVVVPCILIIAISIIILVWSSVMLIRNIKEIKSKLDEHDHDDFLLNTIGYNLKSSAVVFLLTTIVWTSGLTDLAWSNSNNSSHTVYALANAGQGLCVFFFYCVFSVESEKMEMGLSANGEKGVTFSNEIISTEAAQDQDSQAQSSSIYCNEQSEKPTLSTSNIHVESARSDSETPPAVADVCCANGWVSDERTSSPSNQIQNHEQRDSCQSSCKSLTPTNAEPQEDLVLQTGKTAKQDERSRPNSTEQTVETITPPQPENATQTPFESNNVVETVLTEPALPIRNEVDSLKSEKKDSLASEVNRPQSPTATSAPTTSSPMGSGDYARAFRLASSEMEDNIPARSGGIRSRKKEKQTSGITYGSNTGKNELENFFGDPSMMNQSLAEYKRHSPRIDRDSLERTTSKSMDFNASAYPPPDVTGDVTTPPPQLHTLPYTSDGASVDKDDDAAK